VSSLLIQILVAAGIFVAGASAGIKWHAGQDAIAENARQVNQRAVERLQRQNTDTAAERHEKVKAEIQVRYQTITKEVQYVVEKPVYRNICLDDDGLRLIREQLAGPSDAASQPARSVSSPVATP